MKEDKNVTELFRSLEGQWDTEEPVSGHHQRFMNRLGGPKRKRFPYRTVFSIAAALVLSLGIYLKYDNVAEKPALAKLSPEAKETHIYFNSLIRKELAIIRKENTPESKIMVDDALKQMRLLDDDYAKLTAELAEKGENTRIIYAMITNLQTRVAFLKKVVAEIENLKKLKSNHNEKTTV